MKLYISDLHFYHEKVMELDGRNFKNVQEMNDYMIQQWNSKVQGGDIVVVLGDMFWTKEPNEINPILNKLKGKICLLEGNHDNRWINKDGINMDRFEWIKPYAKINDGERIVIASHYPTMCYDHQYLKCKDGSPRTYMLYGHVHNTHDEVLVHQMQELTRRTVLNGSHGDRTIPCNMINCFCKFSDYIPLSLEEWIALDTKRRETLNFPENFSIPLQQNISDEM